ncbi:hypothetical protein CR513_61415, partial [Mucuna pruriens]
MYKKKRVRSSSSTREEKRYPRAVFSGDVPYRRKDTAKMMLAMFIYVIGFGERVVLGCLPGKRFLCCVQSFQLPKQAELHPLVAVVSPTHPASFKTRASCKLREMCKKKEL